MKSKTQAVINEIKLATAAAYLGDDEALEHYFGRINKALEDNFNDGKPIELPWWVRVKLFFYGIWEKYK